ncbi:hypothetical protein ThvES_00009690 [Thiovulum sp. ES]|nr:hypothetical protein ThvES_00009690 [Thiovulum sp. ES]
MKTSRLSLATALALGLTASSLSAANTDLIDLPLKDEHWSFIGVKSGFSETASSGSVFDENIYEISEIEMIDDNLSAEVHGSSADGNLTVSFWVIDHNQEMEYSSAKMYVEERQSDSTNMLNEMYVYSDDANTTPTIRIRYQGQYETSNFYLELNGSANVYEGTFESQAEYDAPQKLTQLSGSGMAKDVNLSINYVWDLNLSNNPGRSGIAGTKNDYTKTDFKDEVTETKYADTTIQIYNYNSAMTSWETCITAAGSDDLSSCDFTEFEPGKGYWVKADNENDSGLILGDGTLTSDDYTLTNGWNMLALNDYDIAPKGGTALLVELNQTVTAGPISFIIEDAEGTISLELNSSPYYYGGSEANHSKILQVFNQQIGSYMKDNNLSDVFNIRFYDANISNTDNNGTLIVSDTKFRIMEKSTNLDFVGKVTTAGGRDPISLVTGSRSATDDLDEAGVSSVFGETALALLRIDDGTTENSLYPEVRFSKYGSSDTRDINLSDVSRDLDDENKFISSSISIDTDFDGIYDTLVVADENGTNFSVQDKTFTRKYQVIAPQLNGATAGTTFILDLEQNRTSDLTVSLTSHAGYDSIANALTNIIDGNGKIDGGDTKELNASHNGDGYIYVMTPNPDIRNFAITQAEGNLSVLKLVSGEGDDNASGIVSNVYSLQNLAQAPINTQHKYDLNISCATIATASSDGYLEFEMQNFSHYPNRVVSSEDGNITVRFGLWDERNTSSKIRTYADSYMSVSGVIVGTDYAGGTAVDVNFSVPSEDLNETCNAHGGDVSGVTKLFSNAFNKFFTDTNTSFEVEASYSDSSIVLVGDINITTLVTADDVVRFAFSSDTTFADTENNYTIIVYESNLTIPTAIENLTYDKVYAGQMNTDVENPLSVLQRKTDADGNNYKITKILTTNEDADRISWNFIDMTKYSSGWFDDNDPYNIFSFHGEKGYWVFLDGGHRNPLGSSDEAEFNSEDISSAVFKYSHEFTGDVDSTAASPNDETINWKKNATMTTTNTLYDGTVTVDVGDMQDASEIDRAILMIDGEKITMTKSGNEYSATFSEYQLEDFGTDSTLDVNVSFFTTDFFSKTIGMTLDNEAPTRPTITINDPYLTDVTFSSSPDTVYFHIYEGDINDSKPLSHLKNTGNTLVDYNISADGTDGLATGYNFCATVQEFNDNLGLYQFIAVDGVSNSGYILGDDYYGDIYYNRVSNVGYIPDSNNSYPIYKNASIYQIPTDGVDRIPVLYGSDCKSDSVEQLVNDDYGFSATSLNGADFNISIETNSSVPALAEAGVDSLATVKVAVDNFEIGKVQFNVNYYTEHNQPVLFAYNGGIYKTDFAILEWNSTKGATAGTGNTGTGMGTINLTDANKSLLSGQAILGSD